MFRASDAPRYKHGLIVCGACALAGAAVVLVWKVLYALQDRKLGRDESVRRNANTCLSRQADAIAADDLEAKE